MAYLAPFPGNIKLAGVHQSLQGDSNVHVETFDPLIPL